MLLTYLRDLQIPAEWKRAFKIMIKVIIFDVDGVLNTNSTAGYYACFDEALKEMGVTRSHQEQRRRIGITWGSVGKVHLAGLLKEELDNLSTGQDREAMLEKADLIYEKHLFGNTFASHLREIEGGAEALTQLRESYILALATGMHPRLLSIMLHAFNIPMGIFRRIESSYLLEDNQAKPSPYMLERIMEVVGSDPDETIKVGDALPDILSARKASVEPILVLSGHLNKEQGQNLGIKHIIPDITQLEPLLAGMKK